MRINYKKEKLLFISLGLIFTLAGCNWHKTNSWTWYEKTTRNVYWNYEDEDGIKVRRQVVEADILSFLILSDEYAKDKNHVYSLDKILEKADPATFKVIEGDYAKDHQSAYWNGLEIEGSDPDSFELINTFYSKDKNSAYFDGKKIENSEPKTFNYLAGWWAKDKNNVYYKEKWIEEADTESFEAMDSFYGKDKNSVHAYFDGEKIELPPFDPASFELINNYYMKDKNNVYFEKSALSVGGEWITMDADPNTFELCCEGSYLKLTEYAKDKDNVYYEGKKIEGVHPNTFHKETWLLEKSQSSN